MVPIYKYCEYHCTSNINVKIVDLSGQRWPGLGHEVVTTRGGPRPGWGGGRGQSQAGHTTPGQPAANQRRAQVPARQVGECGTRAH